MPHLTVSILQGQRAGSAIAFQQQLGPYVGECAVILVVPHDDNWKWAIDGWIARTSRAWSRPSWWNLLVFLVRQRSEQAHVLEVIYDDHGNWTERRRWFTPAEGSPRIMTRLDVVISLIEPGSVEFSSGDRHFSSDLIESITLNSGNL